MHRSKLTGPDAADVAAAGSAAGLAFDRVTDAIPSRETGPWPRVVARPSRRVD